MGKITFKDYKKALLAHYDAIKSEDVTGILLHPTPAQIRQLCNMKIDAGLSRADEDVMRGFFEINSEDSLKISLERLNIDKFKPIISFLKREKDTESSLRVELVAILIGFTMRPYAKFAGLKDDKLEVKGSNKVEESIKSDLLQVSKKPKNDKYKKVLYFLLGLIGFLSVGYVVKDKLMPKKQCMQWQNDRYVEVDCLSKINNFTSVSIEPLKEELIALRKIEVCDTTSFFESGKAIVFYCKIGAGQYDYFNSIGNGYHPVFKKPLKPISQYIIDRYVPECD